MLLLLHLGRERFREEDILRLEIRVYDALARVKVVETEKHVAAYSLDSLEGYPAVVVALDERREAVSSTSFTRGLNTWFKHVGPTRTNHTLFNPQLNVCECVNGV